MCSMKSHAAQKAHNHELMGTILVHTDLSSVGRMAVVIQKVALLRRRCSLTVTHAYEMIAE